MKALLKLGLVVALCIAGGSVNAQEPVKSGGGAQPAPKVVVPKPTPVPAKKGRTPIKAQPAKKAEARPTKEY